VLGLATAKTFGHGSAMGKSSEQIKVQAILSLDETHAEIMTIQNQSTKYLHLMIGSVLETLQVQGLGSVSVNSNLWNNKKEYFLAQKFDSTGLRLLSQPKAVTKDS
jgi:hypothetical protein